MAYKMKGFSGFGDSPAKQRAQLKANPDKSKVKKKKNGDEFGKIKKGDYPSIIQDVNPVEKDKKGLYTTSSGGWIGDLSPEEATSDTTRYPKGFSDWKGELKEGDYIDETSHEAWQGVDVENEEGGATGKRKVYNKKTKKYEDYKKKK
tara:strand:- start:156 stop:599 length:444 start_codon:yes stop_codon:yes gene_type:complete